MTYKRGDFVHITAGGVTIDAMVTLASPNSLSLIVMFDGMLDGHAGAMPLSGAEDGSYVALMTGTPVTLEKFKP
jgi:hypothetical protein